MKRNVINVEKQYKQLTKILLSSIVKNVMKKSLNSNIIYENNIKMLKSFY